MNTRRKDMKKLAAKLKKRTPRVSKTLADPLKSKTCMDCKFIGERETGKYTPPKELYCTGCMQTIIIARSKKAPFLSSVKCSCFEKGE